MYTEHDALESATVVGTLSPCQKSKRGVVIFDRKLGLLAEGFNAPPYPFRCDGSDACREACGKVCVHAEMAAILQFLSHHHLPQLIIDNPDLTLEMLHIKVVNGRGVVSGPPSCESCSKHILQIQLDTMWLLHEDGLRAYAVLDFHQKSLEYKQLPVVR